ncbi:MAG TPA: 6-pyruvoyl-tetrahydropterin synthase-related protein, partial [Vicinamibacteria bacterium]|nr:6-pyruvoyl-tetrahydropterin synthase-related protein [Vicinamibacteria bacterium]
HGWYPGAYLGHPLLLYYFPLPFLLMSALVPLAGLPVAFKIGSVAGVFALPPLAYAAFRLMGFRSPVPLLGAAAAFVFLFTEENPIWGGTMASTLTGEFSYTFGTGLAVLFLGVTYRAYARGRGPWGPAAVLALTAFAHGYAVLWAGFSAAYFLYASRRPERTLAWLLGVAALAFALAGVWLLPLLTSWGWTTPYDDPWISVAMRNLFPPFLWPLFGAALVGLAWTLVAVRRSGGADHRLMFLLHSAAVAMALALAGPALGIIDIRFMPFAQLALCLAGAATLGLATERLAAAHLAALGLVLLGVVHADAHSRVLRAWVDWNHTGLQAKELWPAFARLSQELQGGVSDPRVAVEYSSEHERAGSIRMYETLPLFSGRSTLEGVYNQASLQTHPVYFVASELGARSPNPFRKREYSEFDTESAIRHLRLFNVSQVVALSAKLAASLDAHPEARRRVRFPPYVVYDLEGGGGGYVEPLAYAPVRSSPRGWRDKAYRWFTRKPLSPAHLVFTDDPRFALAETDEWLAPPEVALPGGVEASAVVADEEITITTSRVGHPLLVKVSYHPRWRAEGADGPYLVSPALMLVVPRAPTVRLTYARSTSDAVGLVLTMGSVLAGLLLAGRRWARRGMPPAAVAVPPIPLDECAAPAPTRRWGGVVPAVLIVACLGARLWSMRAAHADSMPLYEQASKAYAAGEFSGAAEYARHALSMGTSAPLRAELLCLRGESLLAAGSPGAAAAAFEAVLSEPTPNPYLAQALFGAARALSASGDLEAARARRDRLLREFGESPWAKRAEREMGPESSMPGGHSRPVR